MRSSRPSCFQSSGEYLIRWPSGISPRPITLPPGWIVFLGEKGLASLGFFLLIGGFILSSEERMVWQDRVGRL